MAKAKQPVTVGGIAFDALLNSDDQYQSNVPEYPVEKGYSINDSIILQPEVLNMTLFVSDFPVTWAGRFKGQSNRSEIVKSQMKELYFSKKTVTVSTTDDTYESMAITDLKISKSQDAAYCYEIPIVFKKVRITKAETTTIPSSYGKSGTSGSKSGTANTKQSTTGSSSASSSKSSGKSQKSSSVLYSVAASAGLL